MPISIRNSAGGTQALFSVSMPDGSQSIGHVLVDLSGAPYSDAHPLLTAPAILAVAFTDRSGTIVTPGAPAVDIAADITRKGGSIRAGRGNTGTITVSLKDASGNLHSEQFGPGESFSMTINGYVIQTDVIVTGDTPGDTFSAVIYR